VSGLVNGQPVVSAPGVVIVPPRAVHLDIKAQVAKALAGVDPGDTMAVLSVQTKAGFNLAVAHKFNDEWQVAAYIGKSGWQSPVEGGVSVSYSR
jgi:hypothetical protein